MTGPLKDVVRELIAAAAAINDGGPWWRTLCIAAEALGLDPDNDQDIIEEAFKCTLI